MTPRKERAECSIFYAAWPEYGGRYYCSICSQQFEEHCGIRPCGIDMRPENNSNEEYSEACESGRASGRLFQADDGRWYFYLGI